MLIVYTSLILSCLPGFKKLSHFPVDPSVVTTQLVVHQEEVIPLDFATLNSIPIGTRVRFESKSANIYEGIFQSFDASTKKIKIIPLETLSQRSSETHLNLIRLKTGWIGPRVEIPAVEESAIAQRIREQARYHRNPNYPHPIEFEERSRKAQDIFNIWLSTAGPKQIVGVLLDQMQSAYSGKERSPGEEANFMGNYHREYIKKKLGIEPLPDGRVPLPRIPLDYTPLLSGNLYFYPSLKENRRAIYENAITHLLAEYAVGLKNLKTLQAAGKNKESPEYIAKENEIFDTIVDFGRVVASFRPYESGNWGIFGPMIHTMVGRLGYEIKYPGFLDIVFQVAEPTLFKPQFAARVRAGTPFYSLDGADGILQKRSKPFSEN